MKLTCMALLILLMSGCQALRERDARIYAEREAQAERERAAYRESLLQNCSAMGFQRGTDAHANCVLSLHQQTQGQAMQLLQMEQQRQLETMPLCSSLPPGTAGYEHARGTCRP